MIDYATIKAMAKEEGCRVGDLVALDVKNDPFYTGRPAEVSAAHWFAELWHAFGYTRGVHLRRIHYQLVSQEPPVMTSVGKPYMNTEASWDFLTNASKYARYLGLVDPAAFVDRRNPEAIISAYFHHPGDPSYLDPTPRYELDVDNEPFDGYSYELPDIPTLDSLPLILPDLPAFEVDGYDMQQPYLIEVWAEKTTQNDILLPLCRRYKVNLITGAGELSITAVIHFLDRAREAGRPARILYVSDYDPAGMGMPISIARKIEYYQRTEGHDDLDIRLEPIVLTAEQVAAYNLPRTPIKDSDLRKATWEQLHGRGATELDALEALRPGEMARIVETAILNYYDPSLQRRANKEMWLLKDKLSGLRRQVLAPYKGTLAAIDADYDTLRAEFDVTRQEFDDLVADFQEKIDAHAEKLEGIKERYAETYTVLHADLEAIDLDAEGEHPLPDPDLPDESDDLLYDGARDYFHQLGYYQDYRGGVN